MARGYPRNKSASCLLTIINRGVTYQTLMLWFNGNFRHLSPHSYNGPGELVAIQSERVLRCFLLKSPCKKPIWRCWTRLCQTTRRNRCINICKSTQGLRNSVWRAAWIVWWLKWWDPVEGTRTARYKTIGRRLVHPRADWFVSAKGLDAYIWQLYISWVYSKNRDSINSPVCQIQLFPVAICAIRHFWIANALLLAPVKPRP